MKTILGFDSWTGGVHNFERLVLAFEKRGYRLLLIHIGSWGHDKDRPVEEMIGRLLVRDISFYKRRTVPEIIELEKASAILFLSTRAFAHMAVRRYAEHMGIPTCHLYHGLVTVQAVGAGERIAAFSANQHLQMIFSRARKNVVLLIPFYLKSLYTTSAPMVVWLNFLKQVLTVIIGQSTNRGFIPGSETTIGLVYTNADIEHMHSHYRIQLDQINAVGNPDIAHFALQEHDIGFALSRKTESKYIMYIDTAYSESGFVYSSREEFIDHLNDTKKFLESIGYSFLVKLHPAHNRNNVKELLQNMGVHICSNQDFVTKLKLAEAAIVEPSTAAIIPAIIGLPVLLCQYGCLRGQSYGEVLTSYPRSIHLKNLDEMVNLLNEERKYLSTDSVNRWISKNVGPIPAEDMPNRVVQAIDIMIQEKERLCAV